ncbi:hypothetical protein ACFFHH_16315 [Cytobacillus solani]|uniref:hypothetical protein n=1 Tax=Cytobacillus solani TaxID=1637975 RepID=UPI001151CA76|nr:hypothetical protein [Cytobacillus solani]
MSEEVEVQPFNAKNRVQLSGKNISSKFGIGSLTQEQVRSNNEPGSGGGGACACTGCGNCIACYLCHVTCGGCGSTSMKKVGI